MSDSTTDPIRSAQDPAQFPAVADVAADDVLASPGASSNQLANERTLSTDGSKQFKLKKSILVRPGVPARRKFFRKHGLFIGMVIVPTLLSGLYFGFIAADRYISESRFVVRAPQQSQNPTMLGALLQGSGFLRAQDEAFTVHDYMLSRDALRELNVKLDLRSVFSNAGNDIFYSFPLPWGSGSFESLYAYYLDRVSVEYDSATSISALKVTAFQPGDAEKINSELLHMGEVLVNKINVRGRGDLIRFAETELEEAESRAKKAATALAQFRTKRGLFDPERQSAIQLQQISKIQDEFIATKTQLAQIKALSPANPQIPTLVRRAEQLEREMASEMAKVAGGNNSFTEKSGEFERLNLERAFAERQVTVAATSLEAARNEARRKQIYLERIVQPNTPDYSLEPKRWRAVLSTFLLGLLLWSLSGMLLAGIKEHHS